MPVVGTTAYGVAEDLLTLARTLMNDPNGTVFTDAVLVPLANSAYRSLQRDLAQNGVSVLVEQVDINLPLDPASGIAPNPPALSDTSNPQLPTDLLVPHALWERVTANTSDVMVPMEKIVSGLPNLQPSGYLRIWEWIGDTIQFIGATQPITVRVRYEKLLPALVLGTDPVQIRSSVDALGYATAALAARARGARELALDMAVAAQSETQKLILRYVRPEQHKSRRRKPYGYRRRIVYL
jgi:hypothetical protein